MPDALVPVVQAVTLEPSARLSTPEAMIGVLYGHSGRDLGCNNRSTSEPIHALVKIIASGTLHADCRRFGGSRGLLVFMCANKELGHDAQPRQSHT